MIRSWIEAMRLRTLPVSIAGVIAGTACAILVDSFKAIPALLCSRWRYEWSIRWLTLLKFR